MAINKERSLFLQEAYLQWYLKSIEDIEITQFALE